MTGQEILQQTKKSLSKQLKLLAKAAKRCTSAAELAQLTQAMVLVTKELRCC